MAPFTILKVSSLSFAVMTHEAKPAPQKMELFSKRAFVPGGHCAWVASRSGAKGHSQVLSRLFLGEPGVWMVSTDSILQTDIVTGVGVARSPGVATVFHDIPGVVKTYREVNPTIPGLTDTGGCAHMSSAETAADFTGAWRAAVSRTMTRTTSLTSSRCHCGRWLVPGRRGECRSWGRPGAVTAVTQGS